ncbi:MAG TPA: acyl-ACP--UDP-N-acetylglucosamine O-acyltransferase [Ignavibacteria bacterium]|nr:acyl-ACP--UDP-N-acetylglucosamine O-acyltransferase [Ignavibacteria bacterium]
MISPKAKIGRDTIIGNYVTVEDDVVIGSGVQIASNAYIGNGSRISDNVIILHSAGISVWPNSTSYANEPTTVEIGEGTIIKGLSTVCRGTTHTFKTVIGKNCYIMNHVHVAHDNRIGDNVVLTNGVNLGGHVTVGKQTNIGGLVGVHQFAHIGEYVMIESSTKVTKDVPPYCLAGRTPLRFMGLNFIGLKRKGFTPEKIRNIKNAYGIIYDSGYNFRDALKKLCDEVEMTEEVKIIRDFIETSERGILPKI